jgi:hypothetical protein
MSQQISTTLTLENQQTVNAVREIDTIIIRTNDDENMMHWSVRTLYDGKVYRKEYYSWAFDFFASQITTGKTKAEEDEAALWERVDFIDNMPIETIEQQKEKAKHYGHGFKYQIG